MRALEQESVGSLLRTWRERRRLSQLELSMEAEISARHLSFIETNRSRPSRDVIARLSDRLEVPLRERNVLLLAAGYAPMYSAASLQEPPMASIRAILSAMLDTPVPTVIVDREWNVVDMNAAASIFTRSISEELLQPPVNALRVALHPRGMAPSIANFAEWRAHLLDRLHREIRFSGNDSLKALYDELRAYPHGLDHEIVHTEGELAVPLRLRHGDGELRFISTIATFGTAADVTVSELMIETFFPADQITREALLAHAGDLRFADGAPAIAP